MPPPHLSPPTRATTHARQAMKASEGDADAIKSCQQELDRLVQRQERHKRQQKKAYAKMIQPKRTRLEEIFEMMQDPKYKMVYVIGAFTVVVFAYIFVA